MNEKVKEATKELFDFETALGQMINSALAGAQSLDDLREALIQGASQLANQAIQASVPGFGGLIFGGLAAFGINQFLDNEEALPTEDDPVPVLLMNPRDVGLSIADVRDSSDLAYSRKWQSGFTLAAQGV